MTLQLCAECEVDRLLELETSMNRVSLEVPVSLQGFLLMAVAHALGEVPGANVGSDGAPMEAIDVAVTNGTSVAAIVKTADRKGLAALASELRDARAGQPAAVPEAAAVAIVAAGPLGGGDFESAYPPLLPGQCCAIALGAASQRPIVRQGAVEVATIAICTLTVDARCVDGEAAMKLLRAVKRRLEDPTEMIL
jgi:pyruvate dehydrogenase E2 component (dihydrolipoamide acetyltransferase)